MSPFWNKSLPLRMSERKSLILDNFIDLWLFPKRVTLLVKWMHCDCSIMDGDDMPIAGAKLQW